MLIHNAFASLEEMLSVEAMSALEERPVERVEREAWPIEPPQAASGCEFLKVRTVAPGGTRHYVVKLSSYTNDIVRRFTDDHACRERLVWQHGLLDRLPAEVESPVVACSRDGEGWALLMRDVSASFQGMVGWTPLLGLQTLSWTDTCRIVDGLVAMHARFYDEPALNDPSLALCTPRQLFTSLGPEAAERDAASPHFIVGALRCGWDLLDTVEASDVATAVQQLVVDPQPLVDALSRFPATLVHGDPRRENVGLTRGDVSRLVLIDWQFASALPPAVDLAWLLDFAKPMEASKETALSYYRDRIADRLGRCFDPHAWEAQLRLALLGQCVRCFGLWLHNAALHESADVRDLYRADLTWWCDQARAGLELL
jgi:hypothetical protein